MNGPQRHLNGDAVFEEQLIDCLDRLETGEPLEQILVRYPENAAELRPLLILTRQLAERPLEPTVYAQNQSREKFLAQADILRQDSGSRRQTGGFFLFPFLQSRRSWFAGLAGIAAAIALAFAATFTLANNALPGEPFYGAKQFLRESRLQLAGSEGERDRLEAEFAAERLQEVTAILADGRQAEVTFNGMIDEQAGNLWTIAGFQVEITPETALTPNLQVGDQVDVRAQAANGRLTGLLISATNLSAVPPTPPAQTPEPTPQINEVSTLENPGQDPTDEPTPTETETPLVPSPTTTPSPSPTSEPTSTATPPPTVENTATPEMVQPPPPPPVNSNANSNDNDDDDANDNDNDDDDDDDDGSSGSSNSNDNENDAGSGGSNSNDNDDDDDSGSNSNDDDDDDDDDDD